MVDTKLMVAIMIDSCSKYHYHHHTESNFHTESFEGGVCVYIYIYMYIHVRVCVCIYHAPKEWLKMVKFISFFGGYIKDQPN